MKALMETQYFKYFVTLADCLSFSDAAKKCHVSQPALSAQIRKMEGILNCELFHRSKREVQLTKEGLQLVPFAKKILQEIDDFSHQATSYSQPFSRRMNIGVSSLIARTNIFERLMKLKSKKKNLEFEFMEESASRLYDLLKEGRLDLIIRPYHNDLDDSLLTTTVLEEDPLLCCYPLGQKNTFKNLPFICTPPGCGLRGIIDDVKRKMNFSVEGPLFAQHVEMILKWIKMGIGWSLLPRKIVSDLDARQEVETQEASPKASIKYCAAMFRGSYSDAFFKEFVK